MELTEGGVATFKDPFEFFKLPFNVQGEYLLKADLNSIKNLCAAAALSKDPRASEFFEELCNNFAFWKTKLQQDFPKAFPGIFKMSKSLRVDENVGHWRKEYVYYLDLLREGRDRIYGAILREDIIRVKSYLNVGVNPDIRSRFNEATLLMDASESGNLEIIRELLKAGATPNLQDRNGRTALMTASGEGHLEIVQALLERGADPNLQNEEGDTALIWASPQGDLEIVRALLEAGADPNLQNMDGDTARGLAIEAKYPEIADLLREYMSSES